MKFEVVSEVRHREVIASGKSVRARQMLMRQYGGTHWRKMKGFALVRFEDGTIEEAELHWYEAHGVGKRLMKLKRRQK